MHRQTEPKLCCLVQKGLREKAEELISKSKAYKSAQDLGNRKKLFESVRKELE